MEMLWREIRAAELWAHEREELASRRNAEELSVAEMDVRSKQQLGLIH